MTSPFTLCLFGVNLRDASWVTEYHNLLDCIDSWTMNYNPVNWNLCGWKSFVNVVHNKSHTTENYLWGRRKLEQNPLWRLFLKCKNEDDSVFQAALRIGMVSELRLKNMTHKLDILFLDLPDEITEPRLWYEYYQIVDILEAESQFLSRELFLIDFTEISFSLRNFNQERRIVLHRSIDYIASPYSRMSFPVSLLKLKSIPLWTLLIDDTLLYKNILSTIGSRVKGILKAEVQDGIVRYVPRNFGEVICKPHGTTKDRFLSEEIQVEQKPAHTSECCICMDAPCSRVIVPCGHFCVCEKCYEPLDTCPICRTQITMKIKLISC